MKKILFDVDVLDKHYCIYLDEETNKSYAYAIKKNEKAYVVEKQEEIDFLNKIVESLNRKYIKREIVNYNDEYYYRYINKYNQKSYFSKIVDNNEVVCSYESIKVLYDYYNSPKILMSRRSKVTKMSEDNLNYGNYNNEDNMNYHRKSKLPIKIAVSILGVAALVTVGLGGYQVLSKSVLPNISASKENIKEDIEEEIKEKTEETKEIDFKRADDQISEKYIDIQKQLSELGLENWEISQELDLVSVTYGEMDDISFYYDGNKDEIVYVDGTIEQKLETDTEEVERDSIPENVQQILSALDSNKTLSDEEKSYIKEKFLSDFIQNSKYLQTEYLVDIYSRLKINYDYKEYGKDVNLEYNPASKASGIADIGLAEITIYTADHFEPGNVTLDHELKHFNGDFDIYDATMLTEGYTSLDISNTYKEEQLMIGLLMETFGTELVNEGYYSSNLKELVANNIVQTSGKTIEEATRETYDFFDDIERVLYKTAQIGDNYRENDELMKEYQDIFNKLGIYYEANNKKPMERNIIVSVIKDEIMGTNDTQMLGSKESVSGIKYSGDGTLRVDIVKNEGNLEYIQEGVGVVRKIDCKFGRSITVGPDEKYNNPKEIFSQIEDEDIDYISR